LWRTRWTWTCPLCSQSRTRCSNSDRLQPGYFTSKQSSWDGEFHNRLLLYNVLLHGRYGGPVHTVALLLRREVNTADLTGAVVRQDAVGREYLRFRYTTVRVWELAAESLLKGKLGATPLALLTDDAESRLPELVDQFADRVARESATTADSNLCSACGTMMLWRKRCFTESRR
jgi:hypothetical protein